MFQHLRVAILFAACAVSALATSADAADRAPVAAAQYSYGVQTLGTHPFESGVYTGPVVRSNAHWNLRIDGEPRTLIRLGDRATDNQDFREDGTQMLADLVYHFRLNASTQEAFDAALARGSLRFDGYTDIFETGGIQTLSGVANVSLFSQYSESGPRTLAFGIQKECYVGNLSDCGRQDFSSTSALGAFADVDTLSFGGTVTMRATLGAPRVGVNNALRGLRVDPILSLVGNGLDQSNYNFEFSQGIGNGALAAVPEPTTWAMMIAGFGIVGGAMRRRKTGAAVHTSA